MAFHLQLLECQPILHAYLGNAAHNAAEFFVFEKAVILPFQLLLLLQHEWLFPAFWHLQVQHGRTIFENIYAERLTIALFLALYWPHKADNPRDD